MAHTRPSSGPAKKRRGRPSGGRKADAVTKPAGKTTTAKAATKRKQTSRIEIEDELSGITTDKTRASRPRKRKIHPETDEIAEAEPESRKKYIRLETKTKQIPQELIETWPQVPPQILEQIVAVIRDAKKDIANTQRDERKVMAAHNTLNPLVRKLTRQLAASRIPPQAKDIHFNIDKLTERNAQISREVTAARHSKQLLSEQVKVAEHLLKKDEDSLEQLKKDTKKWRTEWKHQEKHGRIHPLLQGPEAVTTHGDGPDDIILRPSSPKNTALLDAPDPDPDLVSVLEQLQRSLENMQGNHANVEGINESLRNTQAALDDVLFRHTSAQQYAAF
ncbi:CENP-Q, a CENPA-CAD centromere complex subunit-domain-containing protein [Phaeosphaeriaceae sp. PMI808]|nr:CENP-Q, a CENPA-CAD centromere complex subunit-domain-containing protein [Phaeosphaeriaceae sp. PMI808]